MSTGAASTSIPKYKRRTVSAVRYFPPGCGPNAPRIAARNPVVSKLEDDDRELPRSDDFQIANAEASITMNLISKFPPRRKISAIRDFPPLCGTREVSKKAPSSESESEKKTVGENSYQIVVYDPEKNVAEINDEDGACKEIVVKSDSCESRGTLISLSEMPGKMVTIYALKAVSSCDGFVSESERDHGGTEFSSENNRISNVSVHELMESPNCPGGQLEGTKLTSHGGFHNDRGLKLKHGSSSVRKKSGRKKLPEERRAMKAGLNEGRAISNYIEPKPLRYSRPCGTAIEGEDLDSGEQDVECDDLYAGRGLSTGEINLPPLVPNRTRLHQDSSDHNKVREALLQFQAVYNRLTHENEANVRRGGTNIKRIDCETSKFLDKKGMFVNTEKVVGSVPGVDIGLEFQYREELRVIGLHRQTQAGIDYMNQGGTIIATSIVASGGYDDDLDNADVLNYSGSGGNPPKGGKTFADQKLERGNLALKNSIAARNPVRVIRGHDHKLAGRPVKTYTYDGLYTVTKYWQEQGPNGNLIYMFRLERIPGQPEIAWNLIKNSKKSKVLDG